MTDRDHAIPDGYKPVYNVGFNAYFGPILGRPGEDGAPSHFLFQTREHHLNGAGMIHGGVLMAVADVVLGTAVTDVVGRIPVATISLNCDFVAAGKPGVLIEGRAEVTRRTRTVVFVEGDLYVREADGGERVLLTATGIWKILGALGETAR
jgi:acyl-coenzyme A thioesterase PaaI-like protein